MTTNRMSNMLRVVVVGNSGSGKTTVARELAGILDAPHLELDSLFHRDGFADEAHDEFVPILTEFTSGDRWVVDGNYTSHGTGDVVWPRADNGSWDHATVHRLRSASEVEVFLDSITPME